MLLQRSYLREYGVALLAVLSALLLRALIDPVLGDQLPYYVFYFAVMVAAAFGGFGPGLVTVVVGFISATYFFSMPRYSLVFDDSESVLSAFRFLSLGVAIALSGGWMRSLRQKWQLEIQERRAKESQARREMELTFSTLASIGDGLITVDRTGRVTFMNAVAEQLSGWKLDQAVGLDIDRVFKLINGTTRQPVANPVLRSLKEAAIVTLPNDTSLIDRSGVERVIDDSAAPIRDSSGHLVGSVLIFREVTARPFMVAVRTFKVLGIQLFPGDGAQLPLTPNEARALKTSCQHWLEREWKVDPKAVRFVALNGLDLIVREGSQEQLPDGVTGVYFHVSYQR